MDSSGREETFVTWTCSCSFRRSLLSKFEADSAPGLAWICSCSFRTSLPSKFESDTAPGLAWTCSCSFRHSNSTQGPQAPTNKKYSRSATLSSRTYGTTGLRCGATWLPTAADRNPTGCRFTAPTSSPTDSAVSKLQLRVSR